MPDEEWPDPDRDDGVDPRQLAVRLACSFVAFLVLAFLTRDFLVDVVPMLWPPTEPLGQWSTLVLLQAFGYVLVPLMIGSFVADVLLARVR